VYFTEVLLQTMKFSFNTCHFVLLVTATCTVTSAAEQIIDLGTACSFAILAKAGISTGIPYLSVINGDIGVSPIAQGGLTGFSQTNDLSNTFSTSSQVNGQCFAADYLGTTPASLTAAVSAMEAAYTTSNNRLATFANNPGNGGNIGGGTFYPGVYKFQVKINIDLNITFDAQDDPNAVFIVTTTDQLVLATGKYVILENMARADNIFWNVATGVEIGEDAHMEGNLLCYTKIVLSAGSSLNGRALAQTLVALNTATITKPEGCGGEEDDLALLTCN
jgi:hypothetical protein